MYNICAPALIYLIFSLTQILIDAYKRLYNTVVIKTIVMIMVTLLLNILCEQGLTTISWVIVFIPFILMTLIVSVILYVFGLDASTGTLKYNCENSEKSCGNGITIDNLGNIVIYDPDYNPSQHPVYFKSPNIIVPNPHNSTTFKPTSVYNHRPTFNAKDSSSNQDVPYGSSSPAYQS